MHHLGIDWLQTGIYKSSHRICLLIFHTERSKAASLNNGPSLFHLLVPLIFLSELSRSLYISCELFFISFVENVIIIPLHSCKNCCRYLSDCNSFT